TAGLALLCTISSISPRTSHTVTYTLSLHDALPICGGEEEAEVRVHAADVHVVRPHQETERADGHDRPHHHPIAEDVFSCMDTERSEEHTSELQSLRHLVCRLLLEKKTIKSLSGNNQ